MSCIINNKIGQNIVRMGAPVFLRLTKMQEKGGLRPTRSASVEK